MRQDTGYEDQYKTPIYEGYSCKLIGPYRESTHDHFTFCGIVTLTDGEWLIEDNQGHNVTVACACKEMTVIITDDNGIAIQEEQTDPLQILKQLGEDSEKHTADTLATIDELAKAFFIEAERLNDIIARQSLAIVQKDMDIKRLEEGLMVPGCPIKKKAN